MARNQKPGRSVGSQSDSLTRLQQVGANASKDREATERARSNDLRRGRRSGRTEQISTLVTPTHRQKAVRLREYLNADLADVLERGIDLLYAQEKPDGNEPAE